MSLLSWTMRAVYPYDDNEASLSMYRLEMCLLCVLSLLCPL